MEWLENFLQNILFTIFFYQILILLIILINLLISKIYINYINKINRKLKNKIEEEILRSLFEKKPFTNRWSFSSYREKKILLKTLEEFAHRLRGEEWKPLSDDIGKRYLMKSARRWSRDRSWLKRNFAARQFLMRPDREDSLTILRMLHDPEFLVASVAAEFVVSEEQKEGIILLVKKMCRLRGYQYSYYRDKLLKSSHRVHGWIEELAASERENSELHRVCLDILEHAFFHITKVNLAIDLQSDDKKLHATALSLLSHNPQEDGERLLIEELDDDPPLFRAEAIVGLEYYPSKLSIDTLEKALSDSDIDVRLKAATTLKHMGKEGIKVLKNQDPRKNCEAYEISQYALIHIN